MGKSRAEIQRAYRERQKEKDKEGFMKKERERKRQNYVSSHQLSEHDRKKRNQRNRANLRAFYARKRTERARQVIGTSGTSGYESIENIADDSNLEQSVNAGESSDRSRGRLLVKMDFVDINKGKQKAALKRWKRDRSAAHSRIRILEQERDKLKTKLKSTQRSLQRLRKTTQAHASHVELTPNKQTEQDMNEAKLNKEQREKLRKPLLLGNVISNEIKQTKKNTPRNKRKALHNIISGKITKKYRCISYLSAKTGLGRRQLGKVESKIHQLRLGKRRDKLQKYQEDIITFLKREDNSRMQPGKHDAKRMKKGEKVQIQILTDYLKNLFMKFQSENPDINISFTTFCRARPSYIYKTSMTSRLSCLCFKHQNAALTVKAIRKYIDEVPANPETVSANKPNELLLQEKLPDEVLVSQWKRVDIEEKCKKKTVTRIVENRMDKEQFLIHFTNQMDDFKAHVERVHTQYEQLKLLKQNLPNHHMILQLDFAENYACRSHEEVQSAYFNQLSVTLHPMVAYWKTEDGSMAHKSFITVSDEMAHKSSTVLSFLDDLIPELKQIDPQLNTIHYWSDSPSSQYRNKYIFDAVANHEETYGCRARWNYFESGHGKGPCDGLGGTSKRMADEATRSGRFVISDAMDFYRWGKSSSLKNVTFRFVPQEKCSEKAQLSADRPVKSVVGTMKLHSVVGKGNSRILIRNTSCYCTGCLSDQMCNSWNEVRTINEQNLQREPEIESPEPAATIHTEVPDTPSTPPIEYTNNDYVAAVYQREWYVGKVVDSDEAEVEIDFMEKKKGKFHWPTQKDQIWVNKADILCTIEQPKSTGKSNRMFTLEESTIRKVQNIFDVHLLK